MSSNRLLADKMAIYELQNAYSDAVTRRESHDWISCWHMDGVWEKFDEKYLGKEQILAEWRNIMEAKSGGIMSHDVRLFTCAPGVIEISGDGAWGRSYINMLSESEDGCVTRTAGRYDDIYSQFEGRWVFLSRRFSALHVEARRA